MHTFVTSEFFSVHWPHVQNSPFRNVISSTADTLFNFDPPQTTHTLFCIELTRVHFLQVHSGVGASTASVPETNITSSSKSCSNDAIGTSTMAAISLKLLPDLDFENFTVFSSRLMVTTGLSSAFAAALAIASSLVTVMRLGCVNEAGGRRNAHISQASAHNGLYAYEHLVQVHIRGGVADSLLPAVRFILWRREKNCE